MLKELGPLGYLLIDMGAQGIRVRPIRKKLSAQAGHALLEGFISQAGLQCFLKFVQCVLRRTLRGLQAMPDTDFKAVVTGFLHSGKVGQGRHTFLAGDGIGLYGTCLDVC